MRIQQLPEGFEREWHNWDEDRFQAAFSSPSKGDISTREVTVSWYDDGVYLVRYTDILNDYTGEYLAEREWELPEDKAIAKCASLVGEVMQC